MAKKKNTIFISFSSEDIGEKGYVQAVANAIHDIGYQSDHMDNGVKDASVTQPELDERIRRSRLVIMVLDQKYKDCKRLRHEFEEVTGRGRKIKVLIFIKRYRTPEEEQNQRENIFSDLNIEENRYNRFKNPNDLYKELVIQLKIWCEEEKKREEKWAKVKRYLLYAAVVALIGLLFYLFVHYIKSNHADNNEDRSGGVVVFEDPIGSEGKTPTGDKGEIFTGNKDEAPTGMKGEVGTTGKKSIVAPELSVMASNTFAVVCDDELFSAGICDAVSQISPSITQSVDTSKAQWTISVKHSVQDIPKMLESDALQVEVSYIVNLKNNAKNGKIITKTIKKRGRSIIQNRDDAIRNANEEATKEIANILNQYKNENI